MKKPFNDATKEKTYTYRLNLWKDPAFPSYTPEGLLASKTTTTDQSKAFAAELTLWWLNNKEKISGKIKSIKDEKPGSAYLLSNTRDSRASIKIVSTPSALKEIKKAFGSKIYNVEKVWKAGPFSASKIQP